MIRCEPVTRSVWFNNKYLKYLQNRFVLVPPTKKTNKQLNMHEKAAYPNGLSARDVHLKPKTYTEIAVSGPYYDFQNSKHKSKIFSHYESHLLKRFSLSVCVWMFNVSRSRSCLVFLWFPWYPGQWHFSFPTGSLQRIRSSPSQLLLATSPREGVFKTQSSCFRRYDIFRRMKAPTHQVPLKWMSSMKTCFPQ